MRSWSLSSKVSGETWWTKIFVGSCSILLLTSRYQILPVLAGEYPRSRGDPVRRLFVQTWKGLHDIVQEGAQRGLLGDELLRYVGFIEAGDALVALEEGRPGARD